MFNRKRSWLPLGIDISRDEISIVAAEAIKGRCTVTAAATEAIPPVSESEHDLAAANVLRTLHRSLGIGDRRCILGVPCEDVIVRELRVPPKTRRAEAERAALLEADTIACWPSHDRLIALDPIPGRNSLLLSLARASAIDRLVRLVKIADINPVAVDAPLCAWRRVAGTFDALLDLQRERAVLFHFGKSVGSMELLPSGSSDDRLAALIRAAFMQARRDGLGDVQRIAFQGDASRCATLSGQLGTDGYELIPLTLGESVTPSWAFAYALASWSILGADALVA
jgi:Tfp pilus assembly PilM family ATPase